MLCSSSLGRSEGGEGAEDLQAVRWRGWRGEQDLESEQRIVDCSDRVC